MENEYIRNMQKNDLILYDEGVNSGPGYYIKMLSYNRIQGLLSFTEEKTDTRRRYRYDVRAKQSLTERLTGSKLDYIQLDTLLRSLMEIIQRGKEYLVDENDYVLCPEFIFCGGDSNHVYLCCYPFLQSDIRLQLTGLFEYLLSHIDYQDLSAVKVAYELYMKSKAQGFGFADILSVLDQYAKGGESDVQTEEPEGDILTGDSDDTGSAEVVPVKKDTEERMNEGYCLQAGKKEASIYMKEFPCHIGHKGEVVCEGAALQSDMVHAKLSKRGESVYIEDIKSSNGTFVNGRRIAGNEIQKLNIGDSVMLVDRCYRFVRIG